MLKISHHQLESHEIWLYVFVLVSHNEIQSSSLFIRSKYVTIDWFRLAFIGPVLRPNNKRAFKEISARNFFYPCFISPIWDHINWPGNAILSWTGRYPWSAQKSFHESVSFWWSLTHWLDHIGVHLGSIRSNLINSKKLASLWLNS